MEGLLRRPHLALVAAMLVETVFFVRGQTDFVASDPLWYAAVAHGIATDPSGVFEAGQTHPFVTRIGLTVPLSLLYRAFGVSTLVSNLPSLLAALGILAIVYAAAPTPRAKWIGMGLGVACIALTRNATILNVDLPSAALMALTVLCLSRRDRPRGAWWLAGAAAAWMAAFLVKETAIWCAPVFAYAAIVDVRAVGLRPAARAYAPAIATGAALLAGYLALCVWLWGDPLARFSGVQDLTHEHAWSFHGKPAIEWVHRLTWQTPLLFATMFQALAVPALASPWLVRGPERIWVVATATFLLCYWFGSVSTSAYSPLPISPRMLLPVLPGVLVLATLALAAALERLEGSRWRAPLAIAFALGLVVPSARLTFGVVVRSQLETAAFATLRAEVEHAPDRRFVLVCGEPRCVPIANFHFGFAIPPNVTAVFARDFAAAPRPEDSAVRALVNRARARRARTAGQDLTGRIDALGLPVLAGRRHIALYDAGDGTALWHGLQPP